MGLNGKIAIIVRGMGQPVYEQYDGGSFVDQRFLDDYFAEEELIPTKNIDEEAYPDLAGYPEWGDERPNIQEVSKTLHCYHFDGLNRGMHLEIYLYPDPLEIKVLAKGYQVYRELRTELESYVPNNEWELWIERLYPTALEKTKIKSKARTDENRTIQEKERKGWLADFKRLWGI